MKRLILALAVSVCAAPAHAQTVIDPVTGAQSTAGAVGAGVCAGALDIYGQLMQNNNATGEELSRIAFLRDAFRTLPEFDQSIVASNAESYVQVMNAKLASAATTDARRSVAIEVIQQANLCNAAMRKRVNAG